MSITRAKANLENRFKAPPPLHFRRRRMATGSHIVRPYEAHLSPIGVLSWIWLSSEQTSEGAVCEISSTLHQPRKVDAMLWRSFAALSSRGDEDIRKFSERW